jgi:predicted dehydrogenase
MNRRDLLKLAATFSFGSFNCFKADAKSNKHPMKSNPVKIALLGLGNYAEDWIAPAIAQSENAVLTSIITGSPHKIAKWQKKYSIKDTHIYNYENLEAIRDNKDIDCVYIVTPTGTHADFTVRSFQANKHVICEKPMAPTVADCDRMIRASKKANKTLQFGYRLYWDPFNIRVIDAMKQKEFGRLLGMQGGFSYDHGQWTQKGDWRVNPKMNPGGALFDIGVYVVQSSLYATQVHPLSVRAKFSTDRHPIFKDIPEHWNWELTWPNKMTSQHSSSYGKQENYLRLDTEKGRLEIEPAYSYEGLKGSTPDGVMDIRPVFQQKLQIEGQCLAILKRRPNITPSEMGRRDIYLLNCIKEAAQTQSSVSLDQSYF